MRTHLWISAIVLSTTTAAFAQSFPPSDYRSQVGYGELFDATGTSLPDGSGVDVALIEPRFGDRYRPNLNSSEFTGKNLVDRSNLSTGTSNHATGSAVRLFGNATSMTPGVTAVDLWDAGDWLGASLNSGSYLVGGGNGSAPDVQTVDVASHSYIFSANEPPFAPEINRRLDLTASRDNVTHVVGTNNGAANPLPQGFAHSYNSITVGRTDGSHAAGPTTINGAGRVKPDIVAPQSTTSTATPVVGSAAVLMRATAAAIGDPDAARHEVTKAVLMAGATKDEFASWDQTATRPLDERYGAGELNVANSYRILTAGQFDAGQTADAPNTPDGPDVGWDLGEPLTAGSVARYDFGFDTDIIDASFLLTWDAIVGDAGGVLDYDLLEVPDLSLTLAASDGAGGFATVALSDSPVDNVEHLYFADLAAGDYRLTVASNAGSTPTDYALAWRVTAVPEPGPLTWVIVSAFAASIRRRRTR